MLWIIKLAASYLLIQVFIVHSSEWELATEHSKKENSAGPDISWRSVILFFTHYLWAHIRGRSAENLQLHVSARATAEPEINQFDNTSFVNDDVLKFDVSVCHIPLM